MTAVLPWLLGQSVDQAQFNSSTLGLAAVFLIMLGLVARAYISLQRDLAAVNAARVADGVAHAAAMKAVVEEQTDTLKEVAVVLDRVQTGLSSTIARTRDTSPPSASDDIVRMLDQLARNQDVMSRRLEGLG